jgi:hypothetical protein
MRMIRVFATETQALNFAERVHGKITVQYDWDSFRNRIVKEFIVKF